MLAFVVFLISSQTVPTSDILVPKEYLVLAAGARSGRTPVRTDPLEATIVSGQWQSPKAGEKLSGTEIVWEKVEATKDGSVTHRALRGGYALWQPESPSGRIMVLECRGNGMAYVNGQPRAGDPYGYGFLALPVQLKQGTNDLLFAGGRGAIQPRLRAPTGDMELSSADATLPDLVEGEAGTEVSGVVIRNCTTEVLSGCLLEATIEGKTTKTPCPPLPPLGIHKVPFQFNHPALAKGSASLVLRVTHPSFKPIETKWTLDVKTAQATRKVTFLSGIDGSAQYYGLVPASEKKIEGTPDGKDSGPGIILSLHGAGVEGIGQAAVYAPKSWAHVVAPTNRRNFGFDWEDWGRMDALEVLELASKKLGADPNKTWLTGHSMGGHGTWHIGLTFPGKFGAIAPSAGWISMFSYAGARKQEDQSSVGRMLNRATNPSDTLGLLRNGSRLGVYILHGDADDNVPVDQARTMRSKLSEFHPDFSYFEQPGAGHWWGNQCVDWPPLTRFLQDHPRKPQIENRVLDFVTFHPGISSRLEWAEVEAQSVWGDLSELHLKADSAKGAISGTTKNVTRLTLTNPGWKEKENWSLTLDNTSLTLPDWKPGQQVRLEKKETTWALTGAGASLGRAKVPGRAGPIKETLRRKMTYIVGVSGSQEETRANWDKARFDGEVFYYRGNGALEIHTDKDWEKNPETFAGKNLVLIGNEQNNLAMAKLLVDSPIHVHRGKIDWPGGRGEGDNQAAIFARPMLDDPLGSILVQGASGPEGCRLSQRLSLWVSGSSFPDFLIYDTALLKDGIQGIHTAGYFGPNWEWDPKQTAED